MGNNYMSKKISTSSDTPEQAPTKKDFTLLVFLVSGGLWVAALLYHPLFLVAWIMTPAGVVAGGLLILKKLHRI